MFRIILGAFPAILVFGIVFLNISSGNFKMFLNRELAGKHAFFENRCEKCHVPWRGVSDRECLKCHLEECSEYDILTKKGKPANDPVCLNCHREHMGRSHNLIADDR